MFLMIITIRVSGESRSYAGSTGRITILANNWVSTVPIFEKKYGFTSLQCTVSLWGWLFRSHLRVEDSLLLPWHFTINHYTLTLMLYQRIYISLLKFSSHWLRRALCVETEEGTEKSFTVRSTLPNGELFSAICLVALNWSNFPFSKCIISQSLHKLQCCVAF